MKALRIVQLLCLIAFLLNTTQPANASSAFFSTQNFTTMVKESHRVFYGEVVKFDYVPREEIHLWVSTDITVRIIDNIKGKPNHGDDHVKFYIPGGKRYSTLDRGVITQINPGTPKFKIGEKVFMFLKPHPYLGKRNRRTGKPLILPYDGLIVADGKVEVFDEHVKMPYSYEKLGPNEVRKGHWFVSIPITLAVKIAKASVVNPLAVEPIDRELGAFARDMPKVVLPDGHVFKLPTPQLKAIEEKVDKILAEQKKEKPPERR